MNQYIRKSGCISLILYFTIGLFMLFFIPLFSNDVYLMLILNKLEKKNMIVTEFVKNYNGDGIEYEHIQGTVDGSLEWLDVEIEKCPYDTIPVWYYKRGFRDIPFLANGRVWHYKEKSYFVKIFYKRLIIFIIMLVVVLVVYLINYFMQKKQNEIKI